jgi:hypothetical protein
MGRVSNSEHHRKTSPPAQNSTTALEAPALDSSSGGFLFPFTQPVSGCRAPVLSHSGLILTVVDVAIVTISTFERGVAAESPDCQNAIALPAPEICTP